MEFFSNNEGLVRISVFLGVFSVMALWEFTAPRRKLVAPKPNRWGVNWSIVIIDTIVVRILFPAAAVGAALDAAAQGWGLFSWLDWPSWLEVVLAILFCGACIGSTIPIAILMSPRPSGFIPARSRCRCC